MIAATAPQIQHRFAQHGLQLHRYATSPELCDRSSCSALDAWGGRIVYLANARRTDFMIVVFAKPSDAARALAISAAPGERRGNALLLYLGSAKTRLAIIRRIFHA